MVSLRKERINERKGRVNTALRCCEDVFLPREFSDLGGEDQVLRVAARPGLVSAWRAAPQ